MNISKKLGLVLVVLFFLASFLVIKSVNFSDFDFKVLTTDSGFDSDFGGGSSSSGSSDWGGSSSSGSGSSNWGGSSSSSYSSSNFSEITEFGIISAIFIEAFISIHYYFFALSPLGTIFGNGISSAKITKTLFIIRILILAIGNFVSPYIAIFDFIFLFILAFLIVPICGRIKGVNYLNSSRKKDDFELSIYVDLSEEELAKYGIDSEVLKNKIYNIYVDIQTSWMNNSIENVRGVLSDDMFNMYKTQLLTLERKNQRNIMSDFVFIGAYINSVEEYNDQLVIKVGLEVSCKDYLIDITTSKVIRGNKNNVNDYLYELIFVKNSSTDVLNCPNCNAKLENVGSSVKCSYCGSVIVRNSDNLVMTSKKMIRQYVKK